jgi:large subunit ribosomal protein L33
MAEKKKKTILIRLKCSECQRVNYYKYKNKALDKKLEFKKYCKWCKKHTTHKESKK